MHAIRSFTVSTFAAALLLLSGCKPDAAVRKAEVIGRGTVPSAGTASASPQPSPEAAIENPGNISGTILFSGKPPKPVTIDTSMDPACDFGGGGPVMSEQYAVTAGKLANVFIYVKNGPPAAMQATAAGAPTVLDQKGCRYTPHVVGVMQGGYVEFRNSDPTMHNIHTMPTDVGNQSIDISQGPKGAPVSKRFDKPELMMPVRCNNHPWMNAFINVSPTAFFAVSDANGHFDLHGLPPGDYTLGVVHEKLGEKTLTLTVPPNGTAKGDVSFGMAR